MDRITCFASIVALAACACGSRDGDPPADVTPSTLGDGARIKQITNPDLPTHAASGAAVTITAATTVWVDNYDETKNGKSRGTVYLQDVVSSDPWSGISLFSPTFDEASRHLAPGDVVDASGTYQENNSIPVQFPPGEYLIQVAKPQVKFRYETAPPTPAVIPVSELATYKTARKWLSMLVTIKDVTFPDALVDDGKGRLSIHVGPDTSQNGPTMTNELFDLSQVKGIQRGAHFASITGVVTYFGIAGSFSQLHVAPRTPADLVP